MLQKSYHSKTTDLISRFIQTHLEQGFTAGALSDYLREQGLVVNKTTVYRNLDKLTESGQLVKIKSTVSDGYVYQASHDAHCAEHIHFQCRSCGSVIHLSDAHTAEYLASLSRTLGLEIDLQSSLLNGICPKCRKQS